MMVTNSDMLACWMVNMLISVIPYQLLDDFFNGIPISGNLHIYIYIYTYICIYIYICMGGVCWYGWNHLDICGKPSRYMGGAPAVSTKKSPSFAWKYHLFLRRNTTIPTKKASRCLCGEWNYLRIFVRGLVLYKMIAIYKDNKHQVVEQSLKKMPVPWLKALYQRVHRDLTCFERLVTMVPKYTLW